MRVLLISIASILFASVGRGDEPMPPEKSLERMTLPEGFRVQLVAAEPTLVKPIAITTDDRGRLWVVESHSYPHWITDGSVGKDRVLIFEEHDGKYEGKVFLDKATNLSGIAVGFGGVWLCASPNFLFIPVKPGGDRPAGPAVVVLDGWSLKAKHNVFNGLTWGPDGWLYGMNGILDTSLVGKPGTAAKDRVPMDCGVWRYHPIKGKFEVFANGTTNPWGLDFDERGELFITNCVIEHVFHVVQGAHFKRMYGPDANPNTYGLMQSCADHLHWAGGNWTTSRGGQGAHSDAGGGHAHAGALVYLGDNWPEQYRGRLFMANLHGNRLNQDLLERRGSGYVAKHGKDFLFANDTWFRGLGLQLGADGGVFVTDWHDTGECHNNDKTDPSGRVYKVTFGKAKSVTADLEKQTDAELVKLQTHHNDWWVRHSRRLLQERARDGKLAKDVVPTLRKLLADEADVLHRLRFLWALRVTGGLGEKELIGLLDDRHEDIRGWAIRLLLEDGMPSEAVAEKLVRMAKDEKSAAVRLALASGLQRMAHKQRWPVAEALAAHAEDADDLNLPLMIWYGIEPAVAADPERAAALVTKSRIPVVRQNLSRRLAGL
jgi:putative membrane-bound dehydrogenase-like protein